MARYLEALFFFEKAIELNPQFPEALNNKGSCLFLIGRQKEAIECFTKLFELVFATVKVILCYNFRIKAF